MQNLYQVSLNAFLDSAHQSKVEMAAALQPKIQSLTEDVEQDSGKLSSYAMSIFMQIYGL